VSDTRLRRLADVLVGYSTQVRQGDLVLIEAPALAAPLVREVHSAVLHAGGHPLTRIAIDGLAENLPDAIAEGAYVVLADTNLAGRGRIYRIGVAHDGSARAATSRSSG